MQQHTSETGDQVMMYPWRQIYWRRSLAAVGLLLALGYGGLANAQNCAGQRTTITGSASDETLWVQHAGM